MLHDDLVKSGLQFQDHTEFYPGFLCEARVETSRACLPSLSHTSITGRLSTFFGTPVDLKKNVVFLSKTPPRIWAVGPWTAKS